jgi:hypothetical protein
MHTGIPPKPEGYIHGISFFEALILGMIYQHLCHSDNILGKTIIYLIYSIGPGLTAAIFMASYAFIGLSLMFFFTLINKILYYSYYWRWWKFGIPPLKKKEKIINNNLGKFLPQPLINLIISYSEEWHLLKCINKNSLDWRLLQYNQRAIHLLKKNPEKITKKLEFGEVNLENSGTIITLPEEIHWIQLSHNLNETKLVEEKIKKFKSMHYRCLYYFTKLLDIIDIEIRKLWCWNCLSSNSTAIELLNEYYYNIDWKGLSINPAIFELHM